MHVVLTGDDASPRTDRSRHNELPESGNDVEDLHRPVLIDFAVDGINA
jgi:hypothetical protein